MTDKTEPTHISKDDLAAIQDARANVAYVRALAEKAQAEFRAAELQMRNLVLTTYMKYGIDQNDSIDQAGKIMRAGQPLPSPQEQHKEQSDNTQ